MSNNVKLGIFTLIGIVAIVISIFAVGNFLLEGNYNIYVEFDNIAGLTKKAKVKMAGVNIGILKNVSLSNGKAKLKLSIDKKVAIYKQSYARIVSIGVIGTKYIEIVQGDTSQVKFKDLDVIDGESGFSLENLTAQIGKAFGSSEHGGMIENFADAIFSLKSTLGIAASQNKKIENIFTNLDQFTKNLATISSENTHNLSETLYQIKEIVQKLNALISRIHDGDGPIATLINDGNMSKDLQEVVRSAKEIVDGLNKTVIAKASKLQLHWNYTGRYNTKDSEFKNDIGIRIIPDKDKFYYIGAANICDASSIKDESKKNSINKLEALLGFRRENSEVFGGVIAGTAGIGCGCSFFYPIYDVYKGLKLNLKVYDFTRAKFGPQISFGVNYGITKWTRFGVLFEDIFSRAVFTPYMKVEIDDKDLASILGIIGFAVGASK